MRPKVAAIAAAVVIVCGLLAFARGGRVLAQPTGDPASAPRISLEELKKLHDRNAVLVVDVRSEEAYREGHIEGAVSVPLATVQWRAKELAAKGKPIVTYCS